MTSEHLDPTALSDFVRRHPGGVLATMPADGGFPESAWVDVAVTEAGRIVFGTDRRSRKALNIGCRPEVSFVVVSGGGQEFQVEALARVLGGEEAAEAGAALGRTHPEGGGDPEFGCVVGLEPEWMRWVDVTTTPPTMEETAR